MMTLNEITIEIILSLHSFFQDSEKVANWLKTKNPGLGGITPITMINKGREIKVLSFVNNALDSNRPSTIDF
jgi:hypothetical protein